MTRRYAFLIEYDGRPFVGWQRQNNGFTVQEALETALGQCMRQPIALTVCGRTDSGVHAVGQVAHADLPFTSKPERALVQMINYHIRPHAVAVLRCAAVDSAFEARAWCIERAYCYKILNRDAPPMIDAGRVLHVVKPLCVATMRQAAAHFLGTHDFSTFRAAGCAAPSPIRTVHYIAIEQKGDLLEVHVKARGFLYRQVRSMVGTLIRIGHGYLPPDYVKTALLAADRRACGPVAPPDGLYFMAARYPTAIFNTPDATTV